MLSGTATNRASTELVELNEGRHHDPFALLGVHQVAGKTVLRTLLPFAEKAWLTGSGQALERIPGTDIFALTDPAPVPESPYEVSWTDKQGATHTAYDPWVFAPQLTDFDLHLFQEGKHRHAYEFMGARHLTVNNVTGTRFAVWAPNASHISVVGDFNQWNGRCHPMRSRGGSGIWELFIPGVEPGTLYKFEIRQQHSGGLSTKTDPYARYYQKRPDTAAIVSSSSRYQWGDREWMNNRLTRDWLHEPMSVYEVHLGSWRYLDSQGKEHEFANYRDLARELAAHVRELGFTHIELLPITEHPFDGSWGYQTTGYFAPTSRFGSIDDFKFFVDYLHQAGIGVLLDWVPGHFPKDAFALAHFDGTPLYEHEDPRLGEHRDWGTLIFNFGRNEVKTFLISSAVFWLKEFHIDGLRVDAVASMLYLDYSREEDDWIPNRYGGNENIEAIEFLRELNHVTHSECSGTLTVAEESTAWPQVTRPTWLGGLGFSMKWNMGWMHDSLLYMSKDPVHRHYHHDNLTFGLLYAFTENFVLPFSHDEVVHGKGSMIYKMPGDEWQRFANLRMLYTYMYTYPGKKLLFMGSEFAQTNEWSHDDKLDWHLLEYDFHAGIKKITSDLNHLYREHKALYHFDFETAGFEWIDCHDASQSVLAYLRRFENEFLVVILNFTPIPRQGYRIGVPAGGNWREIHNSDSTYYGGSDIGNGSGLKAEPVSWMSRPYSIEVTLPPLGAIVLQPET